MVVRAAGVRGVAERQTDPHVVCDGVSRLDQRHRHYQGRKDGDGRSIPACARRDAL